MSSGGVCALDIQGVMRALPHRPPFLMVDRLISFDPFVSAVSEKCFSINEDFFRGHFPNFPIVPGVLLIESVAQTGILLHFCSNNFTKPYETGNVPVLASIIDAKFRHPVVPGDKALITIDLNRTSGTFWKITGRVTVEGKECALVTLMAMMSR